MEMTPAAQARTFSVDWWYRHESDNEQTIRQHPQMCSAIGSTAELDTTIGEIRSQGYTIQRIELQAICPRCQSNGRIVVRKYKRQPPKYAECPTCKGDGHVGVKLDWPVD